MDRMNTPADPCPSQVEIDQFLAMDSPIGQHTKLLLHFENCPRCMAYIARQGGEPIDLNIDIDQDTADKPFSAETEAGHFTILPRQFGDYEVVRYISRGGMGVVYECVDVRLNRRVAVKVLNTDKFSSETLARIDREAAIQSRLNHPDIVTVHEFSKIGKWPFIVMELVQGEPLSLVLKGKPIAPRKAALILARLARAIDYAHRMGVMHRDLKPSNVLFVGEIPENQISTPIQSSKPETWSLKVIDFGLSRWLDDNAQQITLSRSIVGTPAYIAPELTTPGEMQFGPSADIYALGVILYECLIGRPPFVADNALQTLELIRSREPVAPAAILPGLPRDLNTICLKCLEKEPAKRYDTARALAEELERYLGGYPIHARPTNLLARSLRWCRRNRRMTAALATAAMLLIMLISGSIYFGYSQAKLRREAEESYGQKRLANENLMQQSAQNTNIAYFATGLFDRVRKDEEGRPISVVALLEGAEQDLKNGKIDTLEASTTFQICLAMAYDRVDEVARADKILADAEETLTTKITHDFSAAPYIKGYLIRAFLQQKKPEKAIQWIQSALENLEQDKVLVSPLGLKLIGQLTDASLAVNRPDQAIPWLEKTLAIQQATPTEANRDMSKVRNQLTRLYQANGRPREADALNAP